MDNFAEVYHDIEIKYETDKNSHFVAMAINIVNVMPFGHLKGLISNIKSNHTYRILKYLNNMDIDKIYKDRDNEEYFRISETRTDATKFMEEYKLNILYNGSTADEIYINYSIYQKTKRISKDAFEYTRGCLAIITTLLGAANAIFSIDNYIHNQTKSDNKGLRLQLVAPSIISTSMVIFLIATTVAYITTGIADGYKNKYNLIVEKMDFIYTLIEERLKLLELYVNKKDFIMDNYGKITRIIEQKYEMQKNTYLNFFDKVKTQINDDDVKLPFIYQNEVKIACHSTDLNIKDIKDIDRILEECRNNPPNSPASVSSAATTSNTLTHRPSRTHTMIAMNDYTTNNTRI